MAKTSGNFDLASQGWLFYLALIFSIFYGFRLFRMAKGNVTGNGNRGRKTKKSSSQQENISEEEKDDGDLASREEEEDLVANDPKEETAVEEKKTK